MPSEFDLRRLGRPVRGKYFARATAGANVVRLAPDVAGAFPTEKSVNAALQGLLQPKSPGRSVASAKPRQKRRRA